VGVGSDEQLDAVVVEPAQQAKREGRDGGSEILDGPGKAAGDA
jgi:hypothetical protein